MKFKMSTNIGHTVATMTWLTVMQYLCYNDNRYAPFVVITLWFFPYTWLITGFVTRVTWQVPHLEQEPPTLPGSTEFTPPDLCCSIFCFLVLTTSNSNMTSFFRFVDKRAIYQWYNLIRTSPRFLCRLTALIKLLVAVQRQSVLYTENSGFASPTLGQHISTFCGYRILFSIINLI